MATEKQLAANRANAQKSTGPTTYRTGLYSDTLLVWREDEDRLRELAADYCQFYNPASAIW